MKGTAIIGIVLIILGIIGFVIGGFSFTTKEKVANVGPLELQKEQTHSVPITPIASGIAVVAGIVLVIVGSKKSV